MLVTVATDVAPADIENVPALTPFLLTLMLSAAPVGAVSTNPSTLVIV